MNKKIQYDIFDLAKFIMSMVVVAIHAHPLGEFHYLIYPWARIAVPTFFIISGYLFFKKYNVQNSDSDKYVQLKKFCIRNLKLYLFWFIVLAPITFYTKHYFTDGIWKGGLRLFNDFWFSYTFRMSWYIMALILGVVIVCLLTSIPYGNILTFVVGIILNGICCMLSNYEEVFVGLSHIFKDYPGDFFLSFPVGILWIFIGKYFSEHNFSKWKTSYIWSGFLVSCFLLVCEQKIIYLLGVPQYNDCYFLLWPVCSFMFLLLLRSKISLKNPKLLREASTVVYCMHGSLLLCVRFFMNKIGISYEVLPGSLLCFLFVYVSCFCTTIVIHFVVSKGKLKWLKYAY